ncbi:lymphocyte antigen 86 isoform X1 [Prionailurus viverrinus]|uniref:lymphocyte antigen 86 isoform X1 n=1 Tax=Prionailurus viverrinus TaxID=61388 RepID=UPI001FF4FA6D|nr:lymphocyte antigen 86 isoform X1 [Prionailurus viverrinus]
MEGVTVVLLLIWTLISPSSNSKAWPPHTVCRDGNLEVFYQSCDPLQDFGFSVDQCSKHLKSNLNIRLGIVLREDIKELFLDIALFTKGSSILNFSYPICEEDLPKFSFCGRRKGVSRGCWHSLAFIHPCDLTELIQSRFIMLAPSIILDLKFSRENTRSCWNCIMRSAPPWPAPMLRSFAPEKLRRGARSVSWELQAAHTEPALEETPVDDREAHQRCRCRF